MGKCIFQLLKDHMVMYISRDIDSFQDGETFFTADNKVLTIHRIQGGKNMKMVSNKYIKIKYVKKNRSSAAKTVQTITIISV